MHSKSVVVRSMAMLFCIVGTSFGCSDIDVCKDLMGQYFFCVSYNSQGQQPSYIRKFCLDKIRCQDIAEHLQNDFTCPVACQNTVKRIVEENVLNAAENEFPDCDDIYFNLAQGESTHAEIKKGEESQQQSKGAKRRRWNLAKFS